MCIGNLHFLIRKKFQQVLKIEKIESLIFLFEKKYNLDLLNLSRHRYKYKILYLLNNIKIKNYQ